MGKQFAESANNSFAIVQGGVLELKFRVQSAQAWVYSERIKYKATGYGS